MPQTPEADALLEASPLALLIGMLLDQQIPMEVAFNGPKKLVDRLGRLDVREIAEYEPEAFATVATTPPAIHRYGGSMGRRVQALCQYVVAEYDGDVTQIWTKDKPTAATVLKRLKALPGYGEQKAKIFLTSLVLTYACLKWTDASSADAAACGVAVAIGCIAHYLGDAITEQGCPILWPVPIAWKTWYPVAPPKILRMRTGGRVEMALVGPLITGIAIWMSAVALQRAGALPMLDGVDLIPWT